MIIWDILFLEGTIILFKAALGILKILKNDLMEIYSIEELNDYLEKREFSFHDISEIVYFLLLRRFEFDNSLINKLRKSHEKKIMKEMNYYSYNSLLDQQIKFEQDLKCKKLLEGDLTRNSCLGVNEKCNLNWPLCIYDKFFKLNLINFLIFTTAEKFDIIDDYFFNDKQILKNRDFSFNDNIYENHNKNLSFEMNKQICKNLKSSSKTQSNLMKVNLINSNFTLKDKNNNTENFENLNDLNYRKSLSQYNLYDHITLVKYSTPETKKFQSVLYENSGKIVKTSNNKNNNFQNFDNKNRIDGKKSININYEQNQNDYLDLKFNDNTLKNKDHLIFVDNKSLKSNDEEDSLDIDDYCLFSFRDELLNENIEKENNAFNAIDNKNKNLDHPILNELSDYENQWISIDKKNKISKADKTNYLDRNKIYLDQDSFLINKGNEYLYETFRRSHSNKLKKKKDIRKENHNRMKIYKTLLINRRKHFCQILNNLMDCRELFFDIKESIKPSNFLNKGIKNLKFF